MITKKRTKITANRSYFNLFFNLFKRKKLISQIIVVSLIFVIFSKGITH